MTATQQRWHVEIVLQDHAKHADVVGGLASGGVDWIRSNKALLRRMAADADFRTDVEDAMRKDLVAVPVSPQFLADRLNLWTAAEQLSAVRPRVGFLATSYLPIGGTETFHRTLIPRLLSAVNVVGFVATEIYSGDGSKLRVQYATGYKAARALAAYCDIVVTWGIDNLEQILPSPRPKVIAVHHADWSSTWSNDTILNQLSVIDSVICVNQDAAETLASYGNPVSYIPNAIAPERIVPSGNLAEIRRNFGIYGDSKIVLFGHRLSPEKRPLLAVEIARELPDGWILIIAGDGSQRQAVQAAAVGCDRVRIVGACDSLADWLAISNCFLSLAAFEGFGLAIAEAMAAGLPVVSTATGIAPGLATTLPTDATATEWAAAIVNAKAIVRPEEIIETYSVTRMVSAWSNVIADCWEQQVPQLPAMSADK